MKKLEEHERSIEVLDGTETDILERLSDLDPTTEEYRKAAENLKLVAEAKRQEVENFNTTRNNLVPSWATGLIGTAVAVLFGGLVMGIEQKGGVVSSNAINFWDKVIRKF